MRIPKSKNKRKRSLFFRIIKFTGMLFLIFIFVGMIACTYIYGKLKDDMSASIQRGYDIVAEIEDTDFNTRYPTVLYDKDGNVLKEFQTVDYIYGKYEETNPYVFKALIAIEDKRFYLHKGFDLKGFLRGIYSTVVLGNTQGGSTITQQLVKNIYLTMESTIWRKITEAVIAQEFEKIYTKEYILEFYINNVNYANGCYSFESASEYYFQKPSTELNIAEIAFITAIPNNPSYYNPLTYMENTLDRKNVILHEMFELGMLSEKEYETEKKRTITLNKKELHLNNDVSDYAQSYAIHKAVEEIMRLNGFQFLYDFSSEEERKDYWELYTEEYGNARFELVSGGYEIYTCIDAELQEKLQEIVNNQMEKYKDVDEESGLYKKQASATVIDNETGMVIAMCGGRTQDDVVNSYNRAYLSARQPGSSIKPLIVYTLAWEEGMVPSDTMMDEPIEKGPKNAGGGYSGLVTLRYAIEKSINTIAYNLCGTIGPEKGIERLATMHFRYLTASDKEHPVISVGGFAYGTNTLEMSSAYSALARNGKYIEPTNLYKIVKKSNQKVLYENKMNTVQVYDEGAAYLMTDTLKGVLTSGTATRYKLNYPNASAKTGTTNDAKDVWLCGYTPYYSMAVWVGNDDPKPQNSMTAQGYIFQKMMNFLNDEKEVIDFEIPECVNIEEDGEISYVLKEKENIRSDRIKKENDRINSEIQKQSKRLSDLSYKLDYGLSNEEEEAREASAKKLLNQLHDYELTSMNQFNEIENLMNDTYDAIYKIKNVSVYEEYMNDYDEICEEIRKKKYALIEQNNQNQSNLWQSILEQRPTEEPSYEEPSYSTPTPTPSPSPSPTPSPTPSPSPEPSTSPEPNSEPTSSPTSTSEPDGDGDTDGEEESDETTEPTESSSGEDGETESGT